MFKPKPKKKLNVNKKTMTTIDNKHGEIIDEMTNQEINEIPKYKKEIEKYFYDHKVITSLGCESILNQVVIFLYHR